LHEWSNFRAHYHVFSDFTVKKVSLKDSGQYDRIDTFGEVLSVAIDPKEEVRLYHALSCSVRVDIALRFFSVEKPRHTLTWSKDGSELFVPSQGCVKVISREGFYKRKMECSLKDVFSTSCLSRCGRYLCASTLSNKIILWKVTDRYFPTMRGRGCISSLVSDLVRF
uniref:WD_REPEATS_REGION domain-containing protein n=1 Tax=Heligmosomoides polygyrus TaxID=6339 RepID=A0A183FPZ7_HELPZ